MPGTLVVFFSRDGHTRRVAGEIAAQCGADLEEIHDGVRRDGLRGYLRCALEALVGAAPPLVRGHRRPQDYALVVIGTPVWFWNIASPVRSYLAAHRGHLPRVGFFCTYGGSGHRKVLADLAALCDRTPDATLSMTAARCDAEHYRQSVARFVGRLRPPRAPADAVANGSDRARRAA